MGHASSLLGKSVFENSILCFHILQLSLSIMYCLTPEQQRHCQADVSEFGVKLMHVSHEGFLHCL